MRKLLRASRVVAATVLTLSWTMFGAFGHAAADTTSLSQVTILPVCSDTSNNTADWLVTNNDKDPATVTWKTDSSAQSDVWNVAAGTSAVKFNTKFNSGDNSVKFVQNGISQVISNIVPCPQEQPYPDGCVDISQLDQGLVNEEWDTRNSVTLSIQYNAQICPGTLTLTSYTLPTNYDGGFFPDNATSVPQTVFDSQTITFTNQQQVSLLAVNQSVNPNTLSVKIPTDPCVNYRVSLYYNTPSSNVTAATYGSNYLGGGLYQATSKCTVPQVLGASTTVPTLTNTGLNVRLTSIFAALLIAAAIFVFRTQPKATEK